jgi:mannose-1-phosphate guanylyltransferase/mannose-6-phosphate isomerase
MIIPVILSGGSGSRLWPLSRELYPKQLLPLVSNLTMLQETVDRLKGVAEIAAPMVVSNDQHRFIVAQQLAEIGHKAEAIILEPVGRNTAPAVAVAALQAQARGLDPVLLILPADHVIRDAEALCAAVTAAYPHARNGRLITFGVVPTAPETGYGYIRKGIPLDQKDAQEEICHASRITCHEVFKVAKFVEKPNRETAEQYLASGDYYWNSGMFMFQASSYLEELQRLAPEMLVACRESLTKARIDLDFVRLDGDAFAACPADSIDYAVMEKTDLAAVLPLDAGWSDVGSWSALWEVSPKDAAGNVVVGNVVVGDVFLRGVNNSYLHTENGRILAVIGLDDIVVVDTADAVLVTRKECCQEVKEIVGLLKGANRDETLNHRKVYRPWGNYESIDKSERFQVKRITVSPGGTLSAQMHHHRAEHWIVVKGTAKITKGSEILLLSENQSTYIPLGVTHRLENPGKIDLELIEVQSGSYLGEDDIVRFEDTYGRS